MTKEESCTERADVIAAILSANSLIDEAQATEVYNILDAARILLAIPRGQRIVVSKSDYPQGPSGH